VTQFARSSRARLTRHDLGRFQDATLFDRIGRALCEAECLPRKELYEAWEVARRARRWFRGGRVVDLGAGHGLLAHVMLLLDHSSPGAIAVDRTVPPSASRIHEVLTRAWPRLAGRVTFVSGEPDDVTGQPGDVVVSAHPCGAFTDRVIDWAIAAGARLAVLPCCHDIAANDAGGLTGWLDAPLAIDVTRALRLRAAGYQVRTQTIPAEITPKNRLLLAQHQARLFPGSTPGPPWPP
jgi:hypothetical protein